MAKYRKSDRILEIYTRLLNGDVVNKAREADHYGVDERSIQRDIDNIRLFFDREAKSSGIYCSVYYDRMRKGYRLERGKYAKYRKNSRPTE